MFDSKDIETVNKTSLRVKLKIFSFYSKRNSSKVEMEKVRLLGIWLVHKTLIMQFKNRGQYWRQMHGNEWDLFNQGSMGYKNGQKKMAWAETEPGLRRTTSFLDIPSSSSMRNESFRTTRNDVAPRRPAEQLVREKKPLVAWTSGSEIFDSRRLNFITVTRGKRTRTEGWLSRDSKRRIL